MRVGILTFHFVNNYGGVLQAYALRRFCEKKFSVDVEIIDYRNPFVRFTDMVRLLPITRNTKAFVRGFVTFPQRLDRIKRYRLFIKNYLKLSDKRYMTGISLRHCPPLYDKYICGSDQIWNPIITGGVDSTYFLDFVKDKQNTCAYAPSFGTNQIHSFFLNKMKKYISNINFLSLRESRSGEYVKSWCDRKVSTMIDPTFLLDFDEWQNIAYYEGEELPQEYILVYIMQSNYAVYEYVKEIKKQFNLPVVDISRYGYRPDIIDRSIVNAGPAEFLALFANASVVCTNSYHGLVFSMIFNKRLYLIRSQNFALRMINLLEVLEIPTDDLTQAEGLVNVIYNYEHLKEVVRKEREKSYQYLRDFLYGKE